MQAAKDGHGADRSLASWRWPLGRNGGGDSLADALVGPVVVDGRGILFFEDAGRLARHDQIGDGVPPAMAAEIARRVAPHKARHELVVRPRRRALQRAIAAVAPSCDASVG